MGFKGIADILGIAVVVGLTATPLHAQPSGEPLSSPYAGLESRPIKALSANEIDDLGAGRGMGMALAAELNGYPGPRHVLDLADRLSLTPRQRQTAEVMFRDMQTEAIRLGESVIEDERALDRAFAERTVTPAKLDNLTARIGIAQAALRAHHLGFHLRMRDLLSAGQTAAYNTLRGYGDAPAAEPKAPQGGHGHRH